MNYSTSSIPIEVFFSYSHKDEEFRDQLANHLSVLERQHIIQGWYDRKLSAGSELVGEILTHLQSAQIILLLISSDFLASDFCWDVELKQAIERHDRGEARVIPVIVRPVDWSKSPFRKLTALPTDGLAVTKWPTRDDAFLNIAQGIREVIDELQAKSDSVIDSHDTLLAVPITDPGDAPSGVLTATGTTRLEVTVEGDLDTFTEQQKERLVKAFRAALDAGELIRIIRVRRGSVIIEFELSPDQAERLLFRIRAGDFDQLGVVRAELMDTAGPTTDDGICTQDGSLSEGSDAPQPSKADGPVGDELHRITSSLVTNRRPYFRWKRSFDWILATLLLIPGLPVIGILIVLMRLTSRGPGIYRQVRVGERGRRFVLYKIRSMTTDAEARTGPVWAAPGRDPRATVIGHWLRKSRLDHLPQLINVVRGEMSLVGPTPERPEFVRVLVEQIPGYVERLVVPQGIVSLASVNLPDYDDLDGVRKQLVLDEDYIRNANIVLDVRILLWICLRFVGIRSGAVTRLLGLERLVVLPPGDSPFTSLGGEGTKGALPVSLGEVTSESFEAEDEPRRGSDSTRDSSSVVK